MNKGENIKLYGFSSLADAFGECLNFSDSGLTASLLGQLGGMAFLVLLKSSAPFCGFFIEKNTTTVRQGLVGRIG